MADTDNNIITVFRGDSWPFVVTITDRTTSTPLDITSYTFKLTVDRKANPSSEGTKLFNVTGVVIDGPNGKVKFTPISANHGTAGNYYYDIQMSGAGNVVKTIVKSQYIINQDISK